VIASVESPTQWPGIAQPSKSDRHYSSHVFTPDDVGFVHLEFQVSHHVRESICVVTVLFSWERNLQNPVSQLT
jgi:hypothetical protein